MARCQLQTLLAGSHSFGNRTLCVHQGDCESMHHMPLVRDTSCGYLGCVGMNSASGCETHVVVLSHYLLVVGSVS